MLVVFLCNCPDDVVETLWIDSPVELALENQFFKSNVDGRHIALDRTCSRRSFHWRWGAYAEVRVMSGQPILHDVTNAR